MKDIDLNDLMPLSVEQILNLVDEENHPHAVEHLTVLAAEGQFEAVNALFEWYLWGTDHVEADQQRALEIMRVFAEQHRSAEAARLLGETYDLYISEENASEKALQWYLFAADLKDADSCFKVGQAYHYGWLGLEEDEGRAIEYLERAVRYGNIPSYGILATIYSSIEGGAHEAKAKSYLISGAKMGDAECQYRLSKQLLDGDNKDVKGGINWLIKAADQADVDALIDLGTRYLSGDGLDKDSFEGFTCIEQAAKRHSKRAQANLSALYLLGVGVEKNITKAYAWLRIALLNTGYLKVENASFVCSLLRMEVLTDIQVKHADDFVESFTRDSSWRYKG